MMQWARKQRVLPLVVVLTLVMMLGYIVFTSNYSSNLSRALQYHNMDPVPTRRALAKRILGVQRKIEFWAEYRGIPTQIEFDGRMTNVKVNPGLVARNHYGHEYLKHAVHWRYSSSTRKDDGSGQEAGMWSMCKEPGFHACLDHFPVDGNLKFKRFTHQLH